MIKEIFYDWGGYNVLIFRVINQLHGSPYDQLMLLGSAIGKYTLFVVYFPLIIAIAYRDLQKKQYSKDIAYIEYKQRWYQTLLTLLVAYLCMLGWVFLLKNGFSFPRPFIALPEGAVNIMKSVRDAEDGMISFPSGHSVFAMLLVAGLWPMLNKIGKIAACLFVGWVALSRIALGVHFPADVIWSLLLSFMALTLVRAVINRLKWGVS